MLEIGAVASIEAGAAMVAPDKPGNIGFAEWFAVELEATNRKIGNAEAAVVDLATGQATSLHHVMLTLDEASTSFHLMLQVRNKLLDGYQEIMRMQI